MNQLANQFLHSVQGWLGKRAEPSPQKKDGDLDHIREAMLDALGEEGCQRYPEIERRVMFAADTYALWYLRPTLALALASVDGESKAFAKLQDITAKFAGHLPRGMAPRKGA